MSNDKQELVVSHAALPAELAAIAQQYAPNAGLEAIEVTDLKRPFYRIIQPTSKELVPGGERYLPEARVGQFIEGAISRELMSEIKFVPLLVIKGYSEFVPQKQGGGFLGFHLDSSEKVQGATDVDYCTKVTPENTELKRTFQLFALIDPVAKGGPVLGILSFTGGALAEVKKFLSYAVSLNHALFLKEYTLTTFPKTNKEHNSTTFRPSFNVDKSVYTTAEIAKAAGEISSKLDEAQLHAMLDATAEAADIPADDEGVSESVNASMS